MVPITPAELEEMLLGFRESAFRLEAQPSYAVGIEREALRQFTEGHPQPPRKFEWWQEWLDLIASHVSRGHMVERVRVLDNPPTDYQRWLLWSDGWHLEAGERIACLTRGQAGTIGLPLDADWWLFDGTQAAVMRFTPGGALDSIGLTEGGEVRPYLKWRELALANATTIGIAA